MGDKITRGLRAFHGTPHKFERFSLEHVGRGEGTQAEGHGLYFSSNKATAGWYRNVLSENKYLFAGLPEITPEEWAELRSIPTAFHPNWEARLQSIAPGGRRGLGRDDAAEALLHLHEIRGGALTGAGGREYERIIRRLPRDPDRLTDARLQEIAEGVGSASSHVHPFGSEVVSAENVARALEDRTVWSQWPWDERMRQAEYNRRAAAVLRSVMGRPVPLERGTKGWRYEVDLGVGYDDLLPWHNRADAWPDRVRRRAEDVLGYRIRGNETGEDVYYDRVGALRNEALDAGSGVQPGGKDFRASLAEQASRDFRNAGIPGHYYRGHSGNNFVMFDDAPIEIIERKRNGGLLGEAMVAGLA